MYKRLILISCLLLLLNAFCKAQISYPYDMDTSTNSKMAANIIYDSFMNEVINTNKYDSTLGIIEETKQEKQKKFPHGRVKMSVLQVEQEFLGKDSGYILYDYVVLFSFPIMETGHGVKLLLTNNYLMKVVYKEFFSQEDLKKYEQKTGKKLYFVIDKTAPWRHFKSFRTEVELGKLETLSIPQLYTYP